MDVPPIPGTRTGSYSFHSERFRNSYGIFLNRYHRMPSRRGKKRALDPFGTRLGHATKKRLQIARPRNAKIPLQTGFSLVHPAGFEPATDRLEGVRWFIPACPARVALMPGHASGTVFSDVARLAFVPLHPSPRCHFPFRLGTRWARQLLPLRLSGTEVSRRRADSFGIGSSWIR